MDERPLSIRARKKVKAEMERIERERLVQMFQKRMELARAGSQFFLKGRTREALMNYYSYIDILERSKKLSGGELAPKHFDPRKDIAEMLLVSGVFWDLAKMHDRSKTKHVEKLKFYLHKFYEFSKGMPYEHVSAELVRKYLVNDLPKNRKEFKDVHIKLGGGKCFIATAVEEHCAPGTLPALRKFRDEKLSKHIGGRLLVKVYYKVSPPLARVIVYTPPSFQARLARVLDRVTGQN